MAQPTCSSSASGTPGVVLVVDRVDLGQFALQRFQLLTECLVGAILIGKREYFIQKLINHRRRLLAEVVDMPVDIGTDKLEIKEVIKGRHTVGNVMEIPEVAFKEPAIVFGGPRTLTQFCWPSWNDRRSGPCLKGGKGLVEIGRPLSIGKIEAMVL